MTGHTPTPATVGPTPFAAGMITARFGDDLVWVIVLRATDVDPRRGEKRRNGVNYIIRAVNSHDALVEALKDVLEYLCIGTLNSAAKYGPDYDAETHLLNVAEKIKAALTLAEDVK